MICIFSETASTMVNNGLPKKKRGRVKVFSFSWLDKSINGVSNRLWLKPAPTDSSRYILMSNLKPMKNNLPGHWVLSAHQRPRPLGLLSKCLLRATVLSLSMRGVTSTRRSWRKSRPIPDQHSDSKISMKAFRI